jgi:hypothetical protein
VISAKNLGLNFSQYIEIIKAYKKPVISYNPASKLVLFQTCAFLPKAQVQASQLPVHISYFLQKCKKAKTTKMDLPLLKNDITNVFYP